MPRKRQPKPWELALINAREARDEAFDIAVKANPELYRTLKNAASEAEDAFSEIFKKYRALSRAQSDARSLSYSLAESGLKAEATIAEGLLAILDNAVEPLMDPLRAAEDAWELAKNAIKKEFSLPE